MVNGYLVDTSVLRVLASVDRLDLLEPWEPRIITRGILHEHGQAPDSAVKALAKALNDKWIRLEVPANLGSLTQKLRDQNPLLSQIDAESILYAEQKGLAIFVADADYRQE